MLRLLLLGALLSAVAGCDNAAPVTTCAPGALCTREPPLVVTGTVQASLNPLPGAIVTLTAYRDTCGGTPAMLLPSPAVDTTNAAGRYLIGVFPEESLPTVCIRVSYSSALFVDTAGVLFPLNPPTPDTLRLNVVGP